MNEQLKMFEDATRETLRRWQETPEQRSMAEENVKLAIIFALNDNFYRGFTSRGDSRNKVMQLGADGIKCALFHNMIQLSDYRHQRMGETLGWVDAYITSVASYCSQDNINDLETIFSEGLKEMSLEQQFLQRSNIVDPKEIDIQRSKLREQRERNNSRAQVAYNYANSIVSCYVWYNTSYRMVASDSPINNFYDQHADDHMLDYYQTKKQQQPNIQM